MTTKISGDNISAIANQGVTWNAVTVADGSTQLNASSGNGYFLDTNAGIIEVFLPSSPTRGDTIVLADYSGTFATNQIIINTGGVNIDSTVGSEFKVTTNNSIVECVYVDAAKGWLIKLNQAAGTTPSSVLDGGVYDVDITYISATGGTITTSGDYKIHTFTGDGCFVVSSLGNPGAPTTYRDKVSYLVVAGGGSGGARNPGNSNGGGGGGGFREGGSESGGCYSASPLNSTPGSLTITATTYSVTVGGGGAGVCQTPSNQLGNPGSNSIFSTITSAGGGGGGGGGNDIPLTNGQPGGSGGGTGGGLCGVTGGTGNTPPVSPPQGNNGGIGGNQTPNSPSAGGGGATEAGQNAVSGTVSGRGGAGATTSISGSATSYAGGAGGGGGSGHTRGLGSPCGTGGDGAFNPTGPGGDFTGAANTGGGGGGGYFGGCTAGTSGAGGKGIVIIRYKYQ